MDVVNSDNEEIALLAASLDCNGSKSPLEGISWSQAWTEGLVTADDVLRAAEDELSLS